MSKHTTYRGTTIDMEAMMRNNEKTVALGNMKVNARGDQIDKGRVTKTADQIARENHRVQSAIVHTGLKGKSPSMPSPVLEQAKPTSVKPTATTSSSENPPVVKKSKVKETELPSGDIVIEDDKE